MTPSSSIRSAATRSRLIRLQSARASLDDRPLISLAHCSVILNDRKVLDDISFDLRPDERWALVGANGAGKTFLLKLLRGDVWPTPTGREKRTYFLDGARRSQPVGIRDLIAYVGPERQDRYVRYDWNFTVTQVVTTGLFHENYPLSKASPVQRARVDRLLRRFGLWGLRQRKILGLSYGQRRLALIARAFAAQPRILLLDEPFNGLDDRRRRMLKDALEQRAVAGMSWVITSHRFKELPANITHLAHIVEGRLFEARPLDKGERLREAPVARNAVGPALRPMKLTGRDGRKPREKLTAKTVARSTRRSAGETFRRSALGDKARVDASRVRAVAGGRQASRLRATVDGKHAKAQHAREDNSALSMSLVPLISLRNVSLYRDYRRVISELNWTIQPQQHWAITGGNGSGKSTLLMLLYGDLHPALGGSIARRGFAPHTPIKEWKRSVGFVSPELQADHYLSRTLEEIVISGRYSSIGLNEPATAEDRRLAGRWLRFFNLQSLRNRGPREVSYGQLRMALIARAMMTSPHLLLLDEPCTGLDPRMRRELLGFIETLARAGTQIVMAVHDREDIVPAIRNVLRIERGRGTVSARR